MKTISCISFLIIFLLSFTESANIMFFFQMSTFSHRIPIQPLMEELANRGHNVTFFHPYKPRSANEKHLSKVHEFLPKSFESFVLSMEVEKEKNFGNFLNLRIEKGRIGTMVTAFFLPTISYNLCYEFISSPDTLQFIESSTFDLIVIDGLFNECAYGLAYKFGAKTIIFGTSVPWPWHHEPFGVVQDTAYLSEIHLGFQIPMNFFQRFISTVIVSSTYYLKILFYYPKLNELFRTKLNMPEMPSITELERQTSLVLYNSHYSEELARSLPPMFVGVGGMHCDDNANAKTLPLEILNFIGNHMDDGFIYVSFGGEAKISETPKGFQKIFFDAFRNSKIKFLWKWEGIVPSNVSENVLAINWVPQKDVLASRNCKGFITHGGMMSIQEAITYGVPMISFPIFAEQDLNGFRLERTGRGINLEVSTVTTEQLEDAISEILHNPKYKENMMKASVLFKDRPQKPLDLAVYWTEYVLRHSDTNVLKPLSNQLNWFQRRLFDVWGTVLFLIMTIMYINYRIVRKIILSCHTKWTSGVSNSNKKSKLS